MNDVSRTITGIIGIVLGLIIIIFGLFNFAALFYGIPILIIGFIILLNKKEDEIEEIKSNGKGGKK